MKRQSMKKKSKPISRIPGAILQKYITTGLPDISGNYLCYTDAKEAWSSVFPTAKQCVVFYDGEKKRWVHEEPVLGWIGPLPILTLDELHNKAPNECGLHVYYIGTPDEALFFNFKQPPSYSSIRAFLRPGKKAQFIYLYNTRKTGLKKLYYYDIDTKQWQTFNGANSVNSILHDTPLKRQKTTKDESVIFGVATKKQVSKDKWLYGQSSDYISIWNGLYSKGDFLWEIRKDQEPIPIHVWKNEWCMVSDFQIKRIQRLIKILKEKE